MECAVSLYLDLMKRCLTNSIYGDMEYITISPRNTVRRLVLNSAEKFGVRLIQSKPYDPDRRTDGSDWPAFAHTMIGRKRMDNLQACVQTALEENIPGDLIETGVWRGGSCIFMRAILKAYGVQDRRVWVADSFAGLPPPDTERYPADKGSPFHIYDDLAVSLEKVKANFEAYGLLDDQVCFLKGWFKDTLPAAPIEKLAVARLDGDMYESTMDALVNLYPRLSPGGFLIVDDYAIPHCREAIHDYRREHNIKEEIVPIDQMGVFWRRDR